MTLIFRLIIRRDIWIFHSKVFSSGHFQDQFIDIFKINSWKFSRSIPGHFYDQFIDIFQIKFQDQFLAEFDFKIDSDHFRDYKIKSDSL